MKKSKKINLNNLKDDNYYTAIFKNGCGNGVYIGKVIKDFPPHVEIKEIIEKI